MKLLTLTLIAASLFGQGSKTKPSTTQLRPPAGSITSIYVIGPTGVLQFATLDSSLKLTCNGSGSACVLSAVVPPAAIATRQLEVINITVPTANTVTLVRAPASELDVIRNGIELSEGTDYTVSGSTITFLAGAEPLQGDILRVKYR